MRAARTITGRSKAWHVLPRLAVPLVFLLALVLNSLAMSAPVQMAAAMPKAQIAAMDHTPTTPHALHQGAKAAHCQEMSQCTGVPVPAIFDAPAPGHGTQPRPLVDERFAGLLPGPPFHPPIL